MGCVYLVRNTVNGKGYVGKTRYKMESRKRSHEKEACAGSNFYFHRSLLKYGFDAFVWTVLEEDDEDTWLFFVECMYIKKFSTKLPNGYNMTDGGEGASGIAISEKTRLKQRIAAYNRSEESNKKVSETLMGHAVSPETRNKLRKANSGKPNLKARGRKRSDEVRKKMSDAKLGKTYEEIYGPEKAAELRKARSLARKGKPLSDKVKQNMSEAQSKRADELSMLAYKRKDPTTGRFIPHEKDDSV